MFHEHDHVSAVDVMAVIAAHIIEMGATQRDPDCPLSGRMAVSPRQVFLVVTGKQDVDSVLRPNDTRFEAFLTSQRQRENSRWN